MIIFGMPAYLTPAIKKSNFSLVCKRSGANSIYDMRGKVRIKKESVEKGNKNNYAPPPTPRGRGHFRWSPSAILISVQIDKYLQPHGIIFNYIQLYSIECWFKISNQLNISPTKYSINNKIQNCVIYTVFKIYKEDNLNPTDYGQPKKFRPAPVYNVSWNFHQCHLLFLSIL